jgi:hypothetical protein
MQPTIIPTPPITTIQTNRACRQVNWVAVIGQGSARYSRRLCRLIVRPPTLNRKARLQTRMLASSLPRLEIALAKGSAVGVRVAAVTGRVRHTESRDDCYVLVALARGLALHLCRPVTHSKPSKISN